MPRRLIQSLLYAREKWKGSGNPDFLCTPHLVNVMLLARDLNGRRIYDNVNELKAALNVNEIITAEQFAGKTRTATVNQTQKTFELLGLMVNFADYSLGRHQGRRDYPLHRFRSELQSGSQSVGDPLLRRSDPSVLRHRTGKGRDRGYAFG